MLIAINAGGPVAAPRVLSEAWYEPFFYLSDRRIRRYENVTAQSDDLLGLSGANWKCHLSEIAQVSFQSIPKWGMGAVPYSGRLFVTVKGRQRDFVLIGNQNGTEIEGALKSGKAPNPPLQPAAEERGG